MKADEDNRDHSGRLKERRYEPQDYWELPYPAGAEMFLTRGVQQIKGQIC